MQNPKSKKYQFFSSPIPQLHSSLYSANSYHFLDHLVNVLGSIGSMVCMSHQILLSRLSQKQKRSYGSYTQSLRLCLFQTQNIVHSILNLLMSLIVPRRSFQIRPQRSLPPLLQWLQNVPFCGHARAVEVSVAPRWASLYRVGNESRGPTGTTRLGISFLEDWHVYWLFPVCKPSFCFPYLWAYSC